MPAFPRHPADRRFYSAMAVVAAAVIVVFWLLTAALVEGVALFAVVVSLLGINK